MAQDSKQRLITYLEELALTDKAIASKLKDKSVKNYDKMMSYISGEAKKLCDKGSNSVCVEDDIVYQWARHYWLDYEEKVEKVKETKTETKANVKPIKVVQTPKKEVKEHYEQMSIFDF